jgi:hypothetical protein
LDLPFADLQPPFLFIRAATCYEDGLGCKKDSGKAVQFYR